MRNAVVLALTAVLSLAATRARGAEENLEALYELSTEGSTTAVHLGETGRFVVSIKAKGASHVSDEAPLKMQLGGKDLTWSKTSLTRADLKPNAGTTFEVTFQPTVATQATAEANVTFFICTKEICARQQRAVKLLITVLAAKS